MSEKENKKINNPESTQENNKVNNQEINNQSIPVEVPNEKNYIQIKRKTGHVIIAVVVGIAIFFGGFATSSLINSFSHHGPSMHERNGMKQRKDDFRHDDRMRPGNRESDNNDSNNKDNSNKNKENSNREKDNTNNTNKQS